MNPGTMPVLPCFFLTLPIVLLADRGFVTLRGEKRRES
jgi:hypothetical protein